MAVDTKVLVDAEVVSEFQHCCEQSSSEDLSDKEDGESCTPHRKILSVEARRLLRRASRSVVKTRRKRDIILHPLYMQLQSLRSIVPCGSMIGKSCVISDTLAYLERLKMEIRNLKSGPETSLEEKLKRTLKDSKVDVRVLETTKIQVHISCRKRPGLMNDLLEALDSCGLTFEKVEVISTGSGIIFNAFSFKAKD